MSAAQVRAQKRKWSEVGTGHGYKGSWGGQEAPHLLGLQVGGSLCLMLGFLEAGGGKMTIQ